MTTALDALDFLSFNESMGTGFEIESSLLAMYPDKREGAISIDTYLRILSTKVFIGVKGWVCEDEG